MRYPTGDLAILSAESYDDGRKHRRSTGKTRVTVADVVTQGSEDGSSRKRRKTSSPDAVGEEEEKKRSRGRPRLEPKDETAQDRRRTQIRLAQRAYRNRKENAIQTLERRVQELKDTNEEMNKAFLRLHDYAVGCGLLDRMPEVGRQLRETTQKFLALARKSTDEAFHDEDHSIARDSDSQPAKRSRQLRKSSSPEPVHQTEASPSQRQLLGGLVVTQEQVSLLDLTSSDIAPGMTSNIPEPEPDPTPDYEVITYPTLDNASFPFGFGSDFSFSTQELDTSTTTAQPAFSAPTTTQPNFPDLNLTSSPLYPSLPIPNSYAAQEVTFGRRFQRTAIERAWTLATMPNPPQLRFSRVFGFCLLFEPLEAIRARLRRGLERTASESLNNWQYPFLQLGNSATHFDNSSGGSITSSSQRFGNQGTADVMRARNANGFGMGPFDAKTSAARDVLGEDQGFPPGSAGFGAEFYDCDEIEVYLHQRGVAIPPAADFVTVEIEAAAFGEREERKVDQQHASSSSSHRQGKGDAGFGTAEGGSVNPLDTFARHTSSGSGSSDANSRSSGRPMSPGAASSGGETALTAPSSSSGGGGFSHAEMWGFGDGFLGLGKKQVTVDVNLLIFEMVERATCLGRSPGLRKEDINRAFWRATKYNS